MNLVKELRERAGMQQKEVALAVGVSRPTVSEWEHQKKDPSGARLKKLAALFNVDPGIVLGYRIADYTTPDSANAIRVPVLGTIPAGIPMEAITDILDWKTPDEARRAILPDVERVIDAYPYAENIEQKNNLLKSVIHHITYHKTERAWRGQDPSQHLTLDVFPLISHSI